MISGRFRLVFERTGIEEKLIWCLKEILQDIEAQEPRDPDAPKPKRRNEEGIEGYEDEHIDACIRELKRHEGCKSVLFLPRGGPSRFAGTTTWPSTLLSKVCPRSEGFSRRTRGLETQLDEKHFKDLEESFISSVHQAKDWLDWWTLEQLGSWVEPVHPQRIEPAP